MTEEQKRRLTPYKIAGIYLILAVLWIYFSDRLLVYFSESRATLTILQTYKGWLFVAVTSVVIFVLVKISLSEIWRSEEELRASEERYRVIFDDSRDAIFITGQDARFVHVNEAASQLTGYTREELLDMSIPDLHRTDELEAYDESFHRIMDGEPVTSEAKILRKDGGEVDTEFSNKRIFIKGVPYMHTVAREITERKRYEESLRRVNRALMTLSRCNHVLVRTRTEEELLHEICRTIVEEGGYRLAWVGFAQDDHRKSVLPVAHHGFEEGYLERLDIVYSDTERGRGPTGTAIRTGRPSVSRNILTNDHFAPWREDALKRGYASSLALPLTHEGRVLGALNIYAKEPDAFDHEEVALLKELATDLVFGIHTLRTRAERDRALEEKETFVSLVEQSSDFVGMATLEGEIVYINEAGLGLVGLGGPDDIENTTMFDYVAEEDLPKFKEQVLPELMDRGLWEGELRYNNFETRVPVPVEVIVFLIKSEKDGSPLYVATVSRDIRERKNAEAALKESEERYRSVFENTGTATVIVEEDTTISMANHEFEKLTGYSRQEIEGKKRWTDFVLAEDLDKMKNYHYKRREGGGDAPIAYEFRFRDKGGNILHTYVRVAMIPGTKRSVASLLDISAVKRAQQELSHEKERLAVTLRSIGDGVISIDNRRRVVLLNKVAEDLTGWTLEEAWGRPIREVLNLGGEDATERYEGRLERVIEEKVVSESPGEVVLVSKGGDRRSIEETISPIHSPDSEVFGAVMVIRDVTERRRLEEEVKKGEKLESLSVVAGGIGHDFNNMLTAILGNLQLAREFAPLGKEDVVMDALARAENAGEKASGLAHQLLTFSRGGAPVKKAASIAEIARDTSRFVLSGSSVASEFEIPDDLSLVEVDAGQISQVFGNLLINAKQAMPEGGTIRVSMENAAEEEFETLPLARGDYVKVSIRDEGEGIPPEQLPKIFDPFFTTKEKGSGLGLATTYSTVKSHRGHISVESEVGTGTAFHVYLPASPRGAAQEEEGDEACHIGEGRILLMDDDEGVRAVAEDMLRAAGYAVETARDGAAAIELYQKAADSGAPFDAVIMDLTVRGGMGGEESISKLLEIDPEAKAIVSSGYSTDPVIAEYRKHGFKAVVLKPFKPEDLRRVVGQVVGKAAPAGEGSG